MSKVKKIRFLSHEVKEILERFPHEPAPLEKDLDSIELKALTNVGRLKSEANRYLGKAKVGFLYKKFLLDTQVRCFPKKNPKRKEDFVRFKNNFSNLNMNKL